MIIVLVATEMQQVKQREHITGISSFKLIGIIKSKLVTSLTLLKHSHGLAISMVSLAFLRFSILFQFPLFYLVLP